MVSINGITYVDHEHCFMTMSDLGSWEIWEVTNRARWTTRSTSTSTRRRCSRSPEETPGYAGLYTTMPAWKDVTIVPAGGRTVLVPVKDYTGMTMFHCHILEHEDIGMMGMWHINGEMD